MPTSVLGGKECDRHFSVLEHTNERVEGGYREVKIIKVSKRGSRREKWQDKKGKGRVFFFLEDFSGVRGGFRGPRTHIGLSRFREVMGTIKWGYIQVEIG